MNRDVKTFIVDSVNTTRWPQIAIVYINKVTTDQNEYGHNIVVDKTNKVIDIIPREDIRGRKLGIPKGGFVASGNDKYAEWLKENVEINDYAFFDSFTSRVLFSNTNEFSPFFEEKIEITGFNTLRDSNTFVIFDQENTYTKTNGYGYEVLVNSDNFIYECGGNNNIVPKGGFVISSIEKKAIRFLNAFGVIGTKAIISEDKKTLTLLYDQESIVKTIELKIKEIEQKLNYALSNYWIIDYKSINTRLDEFKSLDLSNLDLVKRNSLIDKLDNILFDISESLTVETRGIWHDSREKTYEEVEKVILDIKKSNLNQLALGIPNGFNTILPVPNTFPFHQNPSYKDFDVLKAYVDICKRENIELVLTLPIFYNHAGINTTKPEWLSKSNVYGKGIQTEENNFFNPANLEYREYILSYIRFILENYEIDNFQLDYIRYPQSIYGIDYGYDDLTRSLFAKHFNVDPSVLDEIGEKLEEHPLFYKWAEFKANFVTETVKAIKNLINEIRPDIYLSAAVAADTPVHYFCQDIRTWLKEGLIDVTYPMSYGNDLLNQKINEFNSFNKTNKYLVMGSGSYMNLSLKDTYTQAFNSRYKADGIAFFEYNSYLEHGYSAHLLTNMYKVPAISQTHMPIDACMAQIDYMIKRINDVIIPYNKSLNLALLIIGSLSY